MLSHPDGERTIGRGSIHSTPVASGRSTPMASASLTTAHIADSLARSTDGGATLDFSNKHLMDVGEAGAEELAKVGREDLAEESPVLRIALVGNRLATLPMGFSLLSRLRYLTLRSNSFSVFPEVLTIMPSLEILDLSRNKIKRLPFNPGSLDRLRVFSLSRNKLQRLPAYLARFRRLSVFKLDHNPLEWPPKSVSELNGDLDDPETMHRWLDGLREWMKNNAPQDIHAIDTHRRVDENATPQAGSSKGDSFSPASSSTGFQQQIDDDAGVTPHARSFSIDSDISVYSATSFHPPMDSARSERQPPLQLNSSAFNSRAGSSTSTLSPISYLPSPNESLTSTDDDTVRGYDLPSPKDKWHNRNASLAYERRTNGLSKTLPAKKSLPDLRSVKIQGGVEKQEPLRIQTKEVPSEGNGPEGNGPEDRNTPTPQAIGLNGSFAGTLGDTQPLRLRSNSRGGSRPSLSSSSVPPSATLPEKPAPSMDNERNSYFRRLSLIPTGAISSVVPPPLLSLVDSVRGILFAVSQIYQSLQHYTVYAIDERLSSVLQKVLNPASTSMLELITALDRFDSFSRRGCPSPGICRRIFEACRDNVAIFGKAVGVLALQLKVLASNDDVRYTRQMLLVLYGAMAEISNSWATLAPNLEAVEHLLYDRPTLPSKPGLVLQASTNRINIPPIAEQPEPGLASAPTVPTSTLPPPPAPILRSHSALPSVGPTSSMADARTRMSRRHAGSFSIKDVEIGKSLPSNMEMPPMSAIATNGSGSPTPRLATRVPPPLPPPSATIPPVPPPFAGNHAFGTHAHVRQNSLTSSSTPSPGTRTHTDGPSSSAALVDKEAIVAMEGAIKVAPSVWLMVEEVLADMPEATDEMRETLSRAQSVTQRLKENIRLVQEGQQSADKKALREDAHVFVKTVIQLSNVVKNYGSAHRLSQQLRRDIASLTNATQEFVMLLHVSSFSPSSTPRPYSPMVGTTGPAAQAAALGTILEGKRQGASLSRSRSAQPAPSLKQVPPVPSSPVPMSALPNQTFKMPPMPPRQFSRLRHPEDNSSLKPE